MNHVTHDFNQNQTLTHIQSKSRTTALISFMNLRAIHVASYDPL